MTAHGRHLVTAVGEVEELSIPFVDTASVVEALSRLHLVIGQDLRYALCQRGLLSNHKYQHSVDGWLVD